MDKHNKKLTVTSLQKLLAAVAMTIKRFSEEAALSYFIAFPNQRDMIFGIARCIATSTQ